MAACAVTGWEAEREARGRPVMEIRHDRISARTAACVGLRKDRASLYKDITTKIMAELEAGRVPWVQPWGSSAVRAPLTIPKNAATGRSYSGINVMILWGAVVENGFATQSWLTFRQSFALGGHVRKGEQGTTVVYADRFIQRARERPRDPGEKIRAIPFLKRFTVFNVEQCQNLPESVAFAPCRQRTDAGGRRRQEPAALSRALVCPAVGAGKRLSRGRSGGDE